MTRRRLLLAPLRRLRDWLQGQPVAIDYDALVGVEREGAVVLLTLRSETRRPVSFASARQAARWEQQVKAGLDARQSALATPPELADLASTLSTLATRPWATPAHLLSVLVTALEHAAVSTASLETLDNGVLIRCRRFGRLHLGGTLPMRRGQALLEALSEGLERVEGHRIPLPGRYPGLPQQVDVTLTAQGARLVPVPPTGLFTDLPSWGVDEASGRALRDLLGRGPGLVVIAGPRDSGKSTLASVCQTEARLMTHGTALTVIDELADAATAARAREMATHSLVLATIQADDAAHAQEQLHGLCLGAVELVDGLVETALVPVVCHACSGEGCAACQRCGVSGRRGQVAIVRLDSMLTELDRTTPPTGIRRKLTA